MPRAPKLNYDKDRKVYRAQVNGKRVRFTANKRESQMLLNKLLLDNERPSDQRSKRLAGTVTVGACLRRFVKHKQRDTKLATARWYQDNLRRFEAHIGAETKVRDLHLGQVTEFIDEQYFEKTNGKPYSKSARKAVRRSIKACFEWNEEQGFIDSNPFAKLKVGSEGATNARPVTDEQLEAILTHWQHDADFCDVVWFLRRTGCRVQELRVVTAKNIDRDRHVAVLELEDTKGGEKTLVRRQIVLNSDARQIAYRQMLKHPEGPIFRNSKGEPWTANAIRCRLKHAAGDLGAVVRPRDFRHAFATDFLKKGGSTASLKELMGHADERMIMRIYQHLAKDPTFLLEEAERISKSNVFAMQA